MQLKSIKIFTLICLFFSFCICSFSGCSRNKLPEKVEDVDYTIATGSTIPKDLQALIDERKKESFELTFSDDAYLYIVKGYGEQKSGGYSIKINQFAALRHYAYNISLYYIIDFYNIKINIMKPVDDVFIL